MQAWRVHGFGEPAETFVLDEIAEPTAADLGGMGMVLPGWIPLEPGAVPFDDWVIMQVAVAGLALPDVTMCAVPTRCPWPDRMCRDKKQWVS